MWHATYSLSYDKVSGWRPVFHLAEMSSAGGSQKPQVRPFARKLLLGSLLKPIPGFWPVLTHHWIQQTHNTTRKWLKRCRKEHYTEWPRITTFWGCGKAAKTYVLPSRNLALKPSSWLPWGPFRTRKRSSKHRGLSFNMIVWLHSNCQKDLFCHHLGLQRTSLEYELKYSMSAESEESPVIHSKGTRIAHLKSFRTLKIGLSAMGT